MAARNETPRLPTTLLEGRELPPPPQTSFYTNPVPVIAVNVPDQLQQIMLTLKSAQSAFGELGQFYGQQRQWEQQYLTMKRGVGADMAVDDVAIAKQLPTAPFDPNVVKYAPPDAIGDDQLPDYYGSLADNLVPKDAGDSVRAGFRDKFVPAAVDAAIQMRTNMRKEERDSRVNMFVKGVTAQAGIPSKDQAFGEIFVEPREGNEQARWEYTWMRENWSDQMYADTVLLPAAQLAFDQGDQRKAGQLMSAAAKDASPDKWGTMEARLRKATVDDDKEFVKANIQALHYMMTNPTGSTMSSRLDMNMRADRVAHGIGRLQDNGGWDEGAQRQFVLDADTVILNNTLPIDDRIAFAQALVDGLYTFPIDVDREAISPNPNDPMAAQKMMARYNTAYDRMKNGEEVTDSDWEDMDIPVELDSRMIFSPDDPVVTNLNIRIDRLMGLRETEAKAVKDNNDKRADTMTTEIMLFLASPNAAEPTKVAEFSAKLDDKYGKDGVVMMRRLAGQEGNQFRDDNATRLLVRMSEATSAADLAAIEADAQMLGSNGLLSPEAFKRVQDARTAWQTGASIRDDVDVKELRTTIAQEYDNIEFAVSKENGNVVLDQATGTFKAIPTPGAQMRRQKMLRDFDRQVNQFLMRDDVRARMRTDPFKVREELMDRIEPMFTIDVIRGFHADGQRKMQEGNTR